MDFRERKLLLIFLFDIFVFRKKNEKQFNRLFLFNVSLRLYDFFHVLIKIYLKNNIYFSSIAQKIQRYSSQNDGQK
jgi:hypothetical protein